MLLFWKRLERLKFSFWKIISFQSNYEEQKAKNKVFRTIWQVLKKIKGWIKIARKKTTLLMRKIKVSSIIIILRRCQLSKNLKCKRKRLFPANPSRITMKFLELIRTPPSDKLKTVIKDSPSNGTLINIQLTEDLLRRNSIKFLKPTMFCLMLTEDPHTIKWLQNNLL